MKERWREGRSKKEERRNKKEERMVETGDGERETRDERRETCRRYLTLPCLTVLLSCSGFRLRTVQCFTVTGLDRCNTHSYYKVSIYLSNSTLLLDLLAVYLPFAQDESFN